LSLRAQQFDTRIVNPSFPPETESRVVIDAAHLNFAERTDAFVDLLRSDAFRVSSQTTGGRPLSTPQRGAHAVALMCYYAGMTKEVTLRQAGGSVSATLPKDMADRLRLEAGDRVLAVETDRGILLTPYDPEADRALKVAAKAAKKYRNALRALAK
jgi:putative addiction module antidote